MPTTILHSRNEARGFFGTMDSSGTDPMQAWNAAFAMIATATGAPPEGVRDFLDSRHGRHFADEVVGGAGAGKGLEAAIEVAVARWMDWRIDHKTSRETAIPEGLPYLTGFVTHFAILEEAQG